METQEQNNNSSSSNVVEDTARTTKWLAVFGLFALVLALAWFIFTVIAFIPNALSLAGSALFTSEQEEIQTSEIILGTMVTPAVNDEIITLSWEHSPEPPLGSYAVWFACADDVTVQVVTPDDGMQSINCETYYNIGERTSLNVLFQSPSTEITSIDYEIAFVPEDENLEQQGSVGTIVIENPALALREDDKEDIEEEADIIDETEVEEEAIEQPAPEYREDIVYQVPQSDPQGATDLGVRFFGVGILENETFTAQPSFEQSKRGAIRFVVTNHGTRTSENWTYTATLPNGQIYESPTQMPLRPNENATISLGFRSPAETGTYPFSVAIETTRDISTANHSFSWSVSVD